MTALRIAILHVGRDVISADIAAGLATSIRSLGHYVVVGAPADIRAEHFSRDHSNQWDELRSYTWLCMDKVEFEHAFDIRCPNEIVVRPLDGGLDFRDCDFWIFVGELPLDTIAPLKPYSLFITNGIEFVRRNPVETSEAVINTLRGANHLWFSTARQLSDWRTMAQIFDMPLNVARPFIDVKTISKLTSFSRTNDYIVWFTSPHTWAAPLSYLPELENNGHSNQMMIIPIERHSSDDHVIIRWQDKMPLDNTFDNVYSAIAGCSLILCTAIADPFDFRIRTAHKLSKKILMLWNAKYGAYPEQAKATVTTFEPSDRASFDFTIKSKLAETTRPHLDAQNAQDCFHNSALFDERMFSKLLMKAVDK